MINTSKNSEQIEQYEDIISTIDHIRFKIQDNEKIPAKKRKSIALGLWEVTHTLRGQIEELTEPKRKTVREWWFEFINS